MKNLEQEIQVKKTIIPNKVSRLTSYNLISQRQNARNQKFKSKLVANQTTISLFLTKRERDIENWNKSKIHFGMRKKTTFICIWTTNGKKCMTNVWRNRKLCISWRFSVFYWREISNKTREVIISEAVEKLQLVK